MLDPDRLDLDELCFARDDHSFGVSWWIEPNGGQTRPHGPGAGAETVADLAGRR